MGGQACVVYGAAEFSRDADLAVFAAPDNLDRLRGALAALDAETIAVPPFEARYLERGHAVHFPCRAPDAAGLWVDVMSRMRGVDAFPGLWERRTSLELAPVPGAEPLVADLLALPDLVAAKKTQRDKDWPMIRRLVEVNYFQFRDEATPVRVAFWLAELRTPALLVECAHAFPDAARTVAGDRPAVAAALAASPNVVQQALDAEQARERALDRVYWAPLRAELEHLRQALRGDRASGTGDPA